jgi:hypothetical protein
VIECVLTPSPETLKVAVPDFKATVPIVLLPSSKATEPVGVPPAVLTVAVRTTGWLNSEAFVDALRLVVVLTGFTVWATAAELLGAESKPPTKFATTLCVPAASVEITSVAWCVVALTPTLPNVVIPSMNVTGAVGLPPYAGVTVAVNVTACPPLEGFGVDASVVVVEARLTVTLMAVEVLPIKVVFPA